MIDYGHINIFWEKNESMRFAHSGPSDPDSSASPFKTSSSPFNAYSTQ